MHYVIAVGCFHSSKVQTVTHSTAYRRLSVSLRLHNASKVADRLAK